MAVSKRLRHEILRRDNYTCRYCGASAPDVKMTVDHVTPTTLGGSDDPANLVAACADCNAGKSATPPNARTVEDVSQANLRWAAALTLAAEQQVEELRRNRDARAELLDTFECKWTSWWIPDDSENDTSSRYRHPGRWYAPRPRDWEGSIERMIAAGLTLDDLFRAVDIAVDRSNLPWTEVWRYFCGVAWKTLRDRQDLAIKLLESGEV